MSCVVIFHFLRHRTNVFKLNMLDTDGMNEVLQLTMDTGAPGPISIGSNALNKIQKCSVNDTRKRLNQGGVNGEVICSDVVESVVEFAGQAMTVPIFMNNLPTENVDGYCGLGFLRGFDMLITPTEIGFRRNSLKLKTFYDFANKAQTGSCNAAISCLT